jgi:hypothetical protein
MSGCQKGQPEAKTHPNPGRKHTLSCICISSHHVCFFQGMPWRCALFHQVFMCQARYLHHFVLNIGNQADNSSCVQSCPLIAETAAFLCYCQQSACTPGALSPIRTRHPCMWRRYYCIVRATSSAQYPITLPGPQPLFMTCSLALNCQNEVGPGHEGLPPLHVPPLHNALLIFHAVTLSHPTLFTSCWLT